MSSSIFSGSLRGVAPAEWRAVITRTGRMLATGLVIQVTSLVVIGNGNYIKG